VIGNKKTESLPFSKFLKKIIQNARRSREEFELAIDFLSTVGDFSFNFRFPLCGILYKSGQPTRRARQLRPRWPELFLPLCNDLDQTFFICTFQSFGQSAPDATENDTIQYASQPPSVRGTDDSGICFACSFGRQYANRRFSHPPVLFYIALDLVFAQIRSFLFGFC